MKKIFDVIFSYFFYFESSKILSFSRITFYSALFVLVYIQNISLHGNIPNNIRNYAQIFNLFSLPIFSPPILKFIWMTFLISTFSSAIGLAFRLSSILSFLLGSYVFYVLTTASNVTNEYYLLFLALLIMPFSRAADTWSLDSLIGWSSNLKRSEEYGWPFQVMALGFVAQFPVAFIWKLWLGGTSFFFSNYVLSMAFDQNQNNYLLESSTLFPFLKHGNAAPLYSLLHKSPALGSVLGFFSLLFEGLTILLLFRGIFRFFGFISALFVLVGILYSFSWFYTFDFVVLLCFFLPSARNVLPLFKKGRNT